MAIWIWSKLPLFEVVIMTNNEYDYAKYSVESIFQYLGQINPTIIDDIKSCQGKSINDYCKTIWKKNTVVKGKYAENARKHINSLLYDDISRNYNNRIAREAINELNKMPVLQTGPHFQLALEKNNFYSALFSLIGVIKNGGHFYFLSTCTTPSLETRSFYGPAWLNVYDSNFNIFSYSGLYRKRHCVYSSQVEHPYVFKPYYGTQHIEATQKYIEMLKSKLIDIKEPRLVDSLKKANKILWRDLLSNKVMPIFIMEDFYTNLMVRMLKDKNSYINKFFSDWEKQKKVLSIINDSTNLPWGEMIPTATDFFWKVTDRKIKKLKFTEKYIYDEEENIYGENSIPNIIQFLENGEIIPNIYSVIMLESFLGQLKLAGGLHQFAYFETFKKAFIEALDSSDQEEKILGNILQQQNLNHWGSHVLEMDTEILELISYDGETLDKLVDIYSDYPFDNAIDDMVQFRTYHRWGRLLCS